MLDKDFITAVAKGWSCKTSIDWKIVSTAELSKYCKQVEDAISQTMKDILKISDFECKVEPKRIVLLEKEAFGQLGVLVWNQNKCDVIRELIVNEFSNDIIKEKYDAFEADYSKEQCRNYYGNIQGAACFGYQIINKDTALKELGLHLLCHEVLHTLANPQAVLKLRKGSPTGDEATNEFIARIISRHECLGGTTTEEMKNNSDTDDYHNNHGVYRKLIDKEGFAQKTPEEIIQIVRDYLVF